MITLDDFHAFCDADPATVARVARQEQLPEAVAVACTQSRLKRAKKFSALYLIIAAGGPVNRSAQHQAA